MILNAPIQPSLSPLLEDLWNAASFRVCADGGANRLRKASATHIPNVITGDMDSLTDVNRKFYEKQGVKIVPVVDQNRNDLDKAISVISDHFPEVSDGEAIQCVVYGAFGGRFDQEMASMQALYRYQRSETNTSKLSLFLYDDHTMAFLLPAGETLVELALPSSHGSDGVSEGPVCGLIPLGGAVKSVTTTGLKWNLHDQASHFGGLVSTSNMVVSPNSQISIVCSEPLIFTAEVRSGMANSWSD